MTGGGAFMAGIRVLDLSQFIPGPYATLVLADLGADVIKVEPPRGDPQQVDGPHDADGVSAWYKLINRNKGIVEIDLKAAEGRRVSAPLFSAVSAPGEGHISTSP